MFLKLAGKEYKVQWHHQSKRHEFCVTCGQKEKLERYTECVITAMDGSLVAQGFASCSDEDQYVKKVGRMKSFKKVADQLVDCYLVDNGFPTPKSFPSIASKSKRSELRKEVFEQNPDFHKVKQNAKLQAEPAKTVKEFLSTERATTSPSPVP